MPVPVRIVKVLAGGALVEFTDGSTRLVVNETVDAWKRFGLAINEGTRLNPDEVALYQRIVEQFPHYSGLPAEETIPEVIEDVPDVAVVPEVTADSPLYTGHFGQGWLPDFGHNAKVLYLRELERLREKWGTDVPPETSMEDIVTTPKITVPQVSVIDLADTKDLPNTIKAAQSIGSIFYKGRDGKKKLALYARQLAAFELSASYMEGRGSINDQARRWMESQIGAGNKIDFDNIGGGPKQILNKEWDDFVDDVTLPDAGAAEVTVDLTKSDFSDIKTIDDLEKERIDLDTELGEFPARYPDIRELTPSVDRTAPLKAGTPILPSEMAPIETILPYGVPSAQDEGMAEGYMYASPGEAAVAGLIPRMTDTLPAGGVGDFSTVSNLPADLEEALTKGVGVGDAFIAAQQEKLKEPPTWEERYPLGPQEWGEDDAGLADRQWIDPHPNAINVDLGAYYGIPPDKRHLFKKPPESRWDVSRSGGSVWDRERRAAIEGRGRVDEFRQIQAEQDALDKISADRNAWWAQAHAAPDRYHDELGEYDQYGTLSGMQEGIGMTQGIPDPLQGDVLNQRWMGLDEPAPYDVGYFEDAVVPEDYWLDKSETPFLPIFDERAGYGVGGDVQEFMYNGELWYLTKQGHYAKDYKRSELVTPWQTLPTDFFSR